MRTFISLQGKHVFSQGDPEQRGQRLFGGLSGHLLEHFKLAATSMIDSRAYGGGVKIVALRIGDDSGETNV